MKSAHIYIYIRDINCEFYYIIKFIIQFAPIFPHSTLIITIIIIIVFCLQY